MATFTSSLYANSPKAVHVGVNCIAGQYNHAANTASAGDIVWLCKIPHGAQIVDFAEDHTANASAFALSVGLAAVDGGSATLSAVMGSSAEATANRSGAGLLPLVASCTAGAATRFLALTAKMDLPNTGTTSVIINFRVFYVLDAPS